MDYKVIKEILLEYKVPTGKTKHFAGSEELPPASKLQIIQYEDDEGFYLFYLDSTGEVMTDTYHTTIDGAIEQADWEYGIKQDEWVNIIN
jgi:hypothetical protein